MSKSLVHVFVAIAFCIIGVSWASAGGIPFRSASSPLTGKYPVNKSSSRLSKKGLRSLSPRATSGGSINATDIFDLRYMATVTMGGKGFSVQLDTGSSDLWVNPNGTQLSGTNSTSLSNVNISYGSGSVNGDVELGLFSVGPFTVPRQAFLNVKHALQENIPGIMGLGADALSVIYNRANNSPTAVTTLSNIFAQNLSSSNLIGLALERSEETQVTAGGVLSVSEVDSSFADVLKAPRIPVFTSKLGGVRWTVALDAVQVNGKAVTVSSGVDGAPAGKTIALIDSGTSYAFVPKAVSDAIYSQVSGALFDGATGTWVLPCDASNPLPVANLTFVFGGQSFAVNPLDVVAAASTGDDDDDDDFTVCVGPFQPNSPDPTEFDFLLGDAFMRNVYTVYNFGNSTPTGHFTGSPSVQFLSVTDMAQAWANFTSVRQKTLSSARVVSPQCAVNNQGC